METKTVYKYDINNYLVGALVLDDSDRAPISKQFNIPANCTEVEPLAIKDGYKIKWTGNTWEYEEIPVEPTPPEPTLDELKTQKLAELNGVTQRRIVGGFTSNCTGETVKYDSDTDTQLTMQGIGINADSIASKYPTGVPVRGYVGDSTTKTIQYLNGIQILAWQADLSLHIGLCKQDGWQKQAEIMACENKEELDKIILE